MVRIDICIVTCNRIQGLSRLLEGLHELTFEKVPQPDLQILVVDNDPRASANEVFQEFASQEKVEMRYVTETHRGIAFARNTAVTCARQEADFVVFIDDDEVPAPTWLDELLYIQREYDADVVLGRVVPYFSQPPADWIVAGGFYQRICHSNGSIIDYANTANVLVRQDVFRDLRQNGNIFFDEQLALRGGEDALFFKKAIRRGCRIVWANDAVVHEWIPASKANVRWILQRAFRIAQTDTYLDLIFFPAIVARTKRLLEGTSRVMVGTLMLIPWAVASVIWGYHFAVKPIRIIARGLGMLMAVLGIWYEEYRQVHQV